MKNLLFLPLLALPVLLSSCDTVVVERHPSRSSYVGHDSRYYNRDPYRRDVAVVETRPTYYRSNTVVQPRSSYYRTDSVVESRPGYRNPGYAPSTSVRYYNDSRGRYYMNGSRRVYVNAGIY